MTTPGAALAIQEYKNHVTELVALRGELAEIAKAELKQRIEGYENSRESTVTGRRYDGERIVLDLSMEMIDFKMKIEVESDWVTFWQTYIAHIDEG